MSIYQHEDITHGREFSFSLMSKLSENTKTNIPLKKRERLYSILNMFEYYSFTGSVMDFHAELDISWHNGEN